MPNPLSRVKKVNEISFSPSALREAPELAVYIAEIIASWSQTESQLGIVLSKILHIEDSIGISMYLNIPSAESKRKALDGAAEAGLNKEDYKLYKNVMKTIKPCRDFRNDMAHGLWGFSKEIPDALLWMKAKDRISFETSLNRSMEKKDAKKLLEIHKSYSGLINVYKRRDFEKSRRRANQANLALMLLSIVLNENSSFSNDSRKTLLSLLNRMQM